jgi:uncharacterized protein YndB with AHSA1/START domain
MSPITSHIEIARPAEEVFAYATDPSRFSEWQDDVVSARVEAGQAPGVGSRFTTIRRIGRGERAMTQEVTESRPPTNWAAHGVDGPVRPNVDMTLEPLDDNTRSRITVAMDFEGHGIGKLLVPLIVRRLAAKRAPQSYQHLKEQLERHA